MNSKKILPIVLLVVLAIVALLLRRCNNTATPSPNKTTSTKTTSATNAKFDRNPVKFFFTKHARCRMDCRKITQREIKQILAEGTINYSKSNLDDPRGPSYALEGMTEDRQRVRVIFAPKQQHMSVVTVIDLEVDHQCDCD